MCCGPFYDNVLYTPYPYAHTIKTLLKLQRSPKASCAPIPLKLMPLEFLPVTPTLLIAENSTSVSRARRVHTAARSELSSTWILSSATILRTFKDGGCHRSRVRSIKLDERRTAGPVTPTHKTFSADSSQDHSLKCI